MTRDLLVFGHGQCRWSVEDGLFPVRIFGMRASREAYFRVGALEGDIEPSKESVDIVISPGS